MKKRKKDKAEASKDAREFESRLLKMFGAARAHPRTRTLSFEQAIKVVDGKWNPGVLGRPKKQELADLLHNLGLEFPHLQFKEIVMEAERRTKSKNPLNVEACRKLLKRHHPRRK